MTEAGWTREPNFTEVARKLVLKINEIQPDQWDQYDDKDHARIMTALKTTYRQGRVAGLREAANEMCYLIAQYGAGAHAINLFGEWLKEQTRPQPAQDEKGVGDGNTKG